MSPQQKTLEQYLQAHLALYRARHPMLDDVFARANLTEHFYAMQRAGKALPTPPPLQQDDLAFEEDDQYERLNFINFVPQDHIMWGLSMSLARQTYVPVHSVFLAGLAIFSAVASRFACVAYERRGSLPLGMYAVVEQPSGTGKTNVVTTFQHAIFNCVAQLRKQAKDDLAKIKARDDASKDDADWQEVEKKLAFKIFATNMTPEALDGILASNDGHFSGVSSEQGMFNTLFGKTYGSDKKANNNDAVLNGFDGGHVAFYRQGREGYTGHVYGTLMMFAQQGAIETLLETSKGTGLAERFLMVAEPHALGQREFLDRPQWDYFYAKQYDDLVDELFQQFGLEQRCLRISDTGWKTINAYRQHIEPKLADGGEYSFITLRGMAAKCDMQIMKIAGNLHMLSGKRRSDEISDQLVVAAVNIVNHMLHATLALCAAKRIVGSKAEMDSILSLFSPRNDWRLERDIYICKIQTKPFKEMSGNKSAHVRKVLQAMAKAGILEMRQTEGKKTIEYRMR